MGNEPKYASELDRLVAENIEFVVDRNWVADADSCTVAIGPHLQIRQSLEKVWEMQADWKGQVVYRRKDGWTETCRPGEWIDVLEAEYLRLFGPYHTALLQDAHDAQVRKHKAFTPVED